VSGSISWENESPVPDWPKEADHGVPEETSTEGDYGVLLALGLAYVPSDVEELSM
jgi:hypothetical protein